MKKLTTLVLILTALLLLPCLSLAADDMWDIHLPAGLTEIRESAFEGDTSLDRVYVGDNVETIGAQAFANTNLKYIRLPESLTEIAPDAFLNVPHVEVYGAWNADLFAGMDNVSQSGAELPINNVTYESIAAGQDIWRKIPITMTGKWYFHVENCTSATLYDSQGEKIADLEPGEGTSYYCYYNLPELGEVQLCIRNDSDALISAKVYIEKPFLFAGCVSKVQAEYKLGSLPLNLYRPGSAFPLGDLDAHQYYAPFVQTKFDGSTMDYQIDLYVDDIFVKQWTGIFSSTDSEISNFMLEPGDVLKFDGFEAGEHNVRIVVNGDVTEYTYEVTGVRNTQIIGQEASSLYLLPDQHVFATFTAPSDGVYTIQSDIPIGLQLYGVLTDENDNILDSKVDPNEGYDFTLSATLAEGQTITLEAWMESQQGKDTPFFGVTTLVVNEPYSAGSDIFENAQCLALVIGETYENSPSGFSQLPGCKKDADGTAALLAGLEGSPFTVTEKLNLTADEILAAIPKVFADATENDVILFYYSGHGETGSGSLCGYDGQTVSPQALRAALDKIPGTKIILLDSCFSGYLIGRSAVQIAQERAKADLEQFVSAFSKAKKGRSLGNSYFILTASSLYETSIGLAGCSLFTKNLLLGMGYNGDLSEWTGSTPADADNDGMFTLNELFVYCRYMLRHAFLGQTVCPWPYNCDQVLFIDRVPQQ